MSSASTRNSWALGSNYAGTSVATVEVTDAHQGSGSTFRLDLTYADNPHNLPPSVYLKGKFVAHNYTADAAFRGEACYFAEFGDRMTKVINQPIGFFAGVDNTGQAIVVMEDLTRRQVTFNDCESSLTVDQVADGVEQLAAMHASFWHDDLSSHDWVADQGALAPLMMYFVQRQHFDDYIARDRAAFLPDSLKNREHIAAALAAMFENDEHLPQTLCHGDPHLGNTFLDAAGRVGFLDFQTVGRGSYIWDVTYFPHGRIGARRPSQSRVRSSLQLPRSATQPWRRRRPEPRSGVSRAPAAHDAWISEHPHTGRDATGPVRGVYGSTIRAGDGRS